MPEAPNATVGIVASNTPSTSTRRIVSNVSIADPNQDSAGGPRVWGSAEKASVVFACSFMNYAIGWIWPSGIKLDWVRGREGPTVLSWTSSYCLLPPAAKFSPMEAILSMNNNPIRAINDGCLQIQIPDPVNGGRIYWSRQYYVVPLEVLPLSPSFSPCPQFSFPCCWLASWPQLIVSQAKRFYRESGKDKKVTGEIMDTKAPVFAGQILAEMLAGICHQEFYSYSDQEVNAPTVPSPISFPLSPFHRFIPLSL